VRARILERLADGRSQRQRDRFGDQRCARLLGVFRGRWASQIANLRTIERRRVGKTYFYRRTDVVELREA